MDDPAGRNDGLQVRTKPAHGALGEMIRRGDEACDVMPRDSAEAQIPAPPLLRRGDHHMPGAWQMA